MRNGMSGGGGVELPLCVSGQTRGGWNYEYFCKGHGNTDD